MMDFLEILRNRMTYEVNIVISKDLSKNVTDYEILQKAYKLLGRELLKKTNSSYWTKED